MNREILAYIMIGAVLGFVIGLLVCDLGRAQSSSQYDQYYNGTYNNRNYDTNNSRDSLNQWKRNDLENNYRRPNPC